MLIIIPNLGNETDKRFILYRFSVAAGQEHPSTGTDEMPDPTGSKVVKVR
jgi:hypothetical protein